MLGWRAAAGGCSSAARRGIWQRVAFVACACLFLAAQLLRLPPGAWKRDMTDDRKRVLYYMGSRRQVVSRRKGFKLQVKRLGNSAFSSARGWGKPNGKSVTKSPRAGGRAQLAGPAPCAQVKTVNRGKRSV